MKNKKILTFLLVLITFLANIITSTPNPVYASNMDNTLYLDTSKPGSNDNLYTLSFGIYRPEFSDVDRPSATYFNYWCSQPNNEIVDKKNWELRDFSIRHTLYVDGYDAPFTACMTYDSGSYNFNGKIRFEDISIPYNQVETEYYSPENSDYFEPFLLEYNLFLEEADNKMILKIPKLKRNETYTGETQVLRFTDSEIRKVKTPEEKLESAKISKQIEIDEVVLTDEEKVGETKNSIELAEAKLTELKGEAKKAVDLAVTVEELEAITVDKAQAIALLETARLYLNGTSGDDSQDGKTPTNAVKTFEKAKEIATHNQRIMEIIVTGTTPLEGDISLQETNAIVVRSKDFNGYLFSVASYKEATLSSIVIDGNVDNLNIEKALINVTGYSTLKIQSGAILRNNITNTKNYHTMGGAIYANNSTIHMNGGLIDNNTAVYGGGIYLTKSTLNFSGGIIQNNLAKRHGPDAWNQIYAAGGGILADNGSSVNISEQAKVLNNRSDEVGGGISIGSNQGTSADNILIMQGGIIDGNTAGSSGGGIFIQAQLSKNIVNKGVITAGQITNNEMDGSGVLNKAFGGGGIYVNGMPESIILGGRTYNGSNGELEVYNGLITDNSSTDVGAGYAACPVSKTKIYVTDGVAIYENSTNKNRGQDIYILSQPVFDLHGGIPEYQLSVLSLGGVPNEWRTNDGALLPLDKYEGKLPSYTELALHTNNEANELTHKLAKVIISGNSSTTRGGGIGSNGTVTFGTPGTTEVTVQKEWESSGETIPENISVNLVLILDGKEYVLETRQISAESDWQTTFSHLPTKVNGQDAVYSVKEEEVKGYKTTITGNASLGFTITNTYQPDTIEVNGVKTWNDNDNQDGNRPNEIIIRLYANGVEVDKKIVTEADGWKWSFTCLDEYRDGEAIHYTITEDAVAGYTSEVQGFNITNHYTPGKTHNTEKTEVSGYKTWEDNNNKDANRPNEITIRLYANGVEVDKKQVTEADGWKWSFANLDMSKDGKAINYTIIEDPVERYISSVDGYNVTNTYIVEEYISSEDDFSVSKSYIVNTNTKIPKTGITPTFSSIPLLSSAYILHLIRKRFSKNVKDK